MCLTLFYRAVDFSAWVKNTYAEFLYHKNTSVYFKIFFD